MRGHLRFPFFRSCSFWETSSLALYTEQHDWTNSFGKSATKIQARKSKNFTMTCGPLEFGFIHRQLSAKKERKREKVALD